ncbi:MAG: hypothetical protein IJ677_04530 [Alphaproteobacteria bacterium]|nr:hypothetical protein [Alphaproteobacteria bacterium]
MKNFFVLLLKGMLIALAVSLGACFLAWHWGNWRVITWTVIGVIAVWQACKYLGTEEHLSPLYDDTGAVVVPGRTVSFSDRVKETLIVVLVIGMFALILWIGGIFLEWMLNWPSAIFEYTILKGIAFYLVVFFCITLLSSIIQAFRILGVQFIITCLPYFLKWIVIIGISIAVSFLVLYYCFPS